MTAPIIVPDDDSTRQRLIEAHAWAAGIHREDVPKVSDAARRHWEILADASLRELRLLSVAHRDGIEDATVAAILHRAEKAEADRDFDRQQYERRVAEIEERARARWESSIAAQDRLRDIGTRVLAAHRARRKTVRVADLVAGTGYERTDR
jgi:hypothetical protein